MPFVNVKITQRNVTIDAKAQIVAEITDTLVRVLGKKPESCHVVIDVVADEDWGHAGKLVAHRQKVAGN